MKKDFIDEVIEELQKLKDAQKQVTITTPIAPHKVVSVIGQVIKKHELTPEEKKDFVAAIAMMDGVLSPAELAELRELDKHSTSCEGRDEQ